jgi:hypothetical protein
VTGSSQHGNERPGRIKGGKIFSEIKDSQLIKEDSSPSSWLVMMLYRLHAKI